MTFKSNVTVPSNGVQQVNVYDQHSKEVASIPMRGAHEHLASLISVFEEIKNEIGNSNQIVTLKVAGITPLTNSAYTWECKPELSIKKDTDIEKLDKLTVQFTDSFKCYIGDVVN